MDLRYTTYEVNDGVAVITLDRPDKMNAWIPETGAELHHCLGRADADEKVRVIILTGAGRAFCAGGDLEWLSGLPTATEEDEQIIAWTHELPWTDGTSPDWLGAVSILAAVSKPVIAAVNGAAAGIGFALMCFADVRFAAAGAKLTTSFSRLGLPAEHGTSWVLSRLIGAGRAADLLYSSRVVLAEEAEGMGLVNRVLPADELLPATIAYASAMVAECAPSSFAAMKRQLWGDLQGSLHQAWQRTQQHVRTVVRSAEFAEGLAAHRERRPPQFPGVSAGPLA